MQANILITGFVQGVGFRQFVKRKAKELSLTGWVRNLPDGSVEAIISGAENNIKLLIDYCKKGPFMSEVENLQISWEEDGEKFEEFIIRID